MIPRPHRARPWAARASAAFAVALVAALLAFGVLASGPKRVLIVHSFNRDFAPFDVAVSVFRTELARRYNGPITYIEANLDANRPITERKEQAFVDFLNARFEDAPPDVVVTVGAPAARFGVRRAGEPFAAAPMVIGAVDERRVAQIEPRPNDRVVASRIEIPKLIDNILQLLPETETIAVVIGASEFERFWLAELQRELAAFEGRVKFEWLNHLSFVQMQERVAALPPHSAVLYALFVVDAAGVPHERQDALIGLRAVTKAPIFGVYEREVGNGVVGGPYTSQRRIGEQMAASALLALEGGASSDRKIHVDAFEPPVYDWRELQRWDIEPSRLPPGSEIRFKAPSLWEERRVAVIATLTALLLQAALIAALLAQRAHRRRAELEAKGLAGRLVTAHEDERRRLARELHDDVTQRLAGLAIEAADLAGRTKETAGAEIAHSIREGLTELGEDVHALSYRLHPSVIEDLGLVEALRIECDRVTQQGLLRVKFDCRGVPRGLSPDAALCLFRVAQEALRNVERHARARRVDVSVSERDRGIALSVRDDGNGFDAARGPGRASLGLASMRERVRLLGGRLQIQSAQGAGTSLVAWVPLAEAT